MNVETSRSQSFSDEHIVEKDIEFIAPSSSYYKSQNSNFVEDAFNHQSGVNEAFLGSSKEKEKEKAMSVDKHDINQAVKRKNSKKSLKDKPNSNSSGKDSSSIAEKSFMSRISYFSPEQGLNIKSSIEK